MTLKKERPVVTPSDIGDYEIPGWTPFQQWIATLACGIGFLGFCALVWVLGS
jgi:hypothetical protein